MQKNWIGFVMCMAMAACDPGPVLDEGEIQSELNNQVEDTIADSEESTSQQVDENEEDSDSGDTDMEFVDSDEITEDDTNVDDVDSEVDTDADSDDDTEETGSDICVPNLIINEVDYDVPGTDTAEFIELYNASDCAVSLDGLSVVLVNGADMTEYRRILLLDAGVTELGPGEYLVIYGSDLVLDASVVGIELTTSGFVQNGPDGIAIIDETSQSVLDSFSYEGVMDGVMIDGFDGTYNLVEGEMNLELADSAEESVSLGRAVNGVDTNHTATDWTVTIATPGASNEVMES